MADFSRKIGAGTAVGEFSGRLGRSGISGGLNPKYAKASPSVPAIAVSSGSGTDDSIEGESTAALGIGNLISPLDDKEQEKVASVTAKIRSAGMKAAATPAQHDPTQFYANFNYAPDKYDPVATREAYRARRKEKQAAVDDPKTMAILIALFFSAILIYKGAASVNSWRGAKDALKIEGSVYEGLPEGSQTLFDLYPTEKKR